MLEHLSLVHWEAAILCPETKVDAKDRFLLNYKAKNARNTTKFNRYDEALMHLKERVEKVVTGRTK